MVCGVDTGDARPYDENIDMTGRFGIYSGICIGSIHLGLLGWLLFSGTALIPLPD
jgi:hypothetical protein